MIMWRSLLLTLAVTCLSHESAAAAPTRIYVEGPCAGCRAVVPAGATSGRKVPILVALHGDWGVSTLDLMRAWEPHALSRGVGVLSLTCPKELGCRGSYWRWNGDPSWVMSQVVALSRTRQIAIDMSRVYLAGWSGGASYMGMHAAELSRSFAALVYHGGGVAPSTDDCAASASGLRASKRDDDSSGAPKKAAPVLFLVGSGNPLHHLARQLRTYHEGCHDEVSFRLLPGAQHEEEWRALASRGGPIVDWLLDKHREE